jgi:hypothetical protein
MKPTHVSGIVALALAAAVALDVALAAPPADPTPRGARPAAPGAPPTAGADRGAVKPKSRRVLIFGTTIVGDVLKPTIEKSMPWQNPPAFRANAAPLAHDFTQELLAPLDRDQILRETDDHAH